MTFTRMHNFFRPINFRLGEESLESYASGLGRLWGEAGSTFVLLKRKEKQEVVRKV
jgi:hypothetical protein